VDDPRESDDDQRAAAASNSRNSRAETGGELFISSAPAHASIAARQIIGELRHQYVLAFEASAAPAGGHCRFRTAKDS
jgi:hypothetical protein